MKIGRNSVDMKEKIEKFNFKEMKSELQWMAQYIKDYRGRIFFLIFIGVASVLMGLAGTYLSKELIDGVTTGVFSGIWGNLAQVIIAMVLFTGVSLAATAVQNLYTARFRLDVSRQMKKELFSQIMGSDWLDLTKHHSGDLVNRMTRDLDNVVNGVTGIVPTLAVSGMRFLAAFALMVYYDPMVAALSFLMGPVLLIASRFLTGRMRAYSIENQEVFGKNQSFIQEAVQNVLIVKTFSLKSLFERKMGDLQDEMYDVSYKQTRFATFSNIAIHIMSQIVYLLILGWCAYRLFTNSITVGTLVLFLNLAGKIQAPFTSLVALVPTVIGSAASAGRIMELYRIPQEKNGRENGSVLAGKSAGVKIKNASFAYQEKELVLDNVSFYAAPGEMTALIGPSGEGKTTLLRLILGLANVQTGSIAVCSCVGHVPVSAGTRRYFSYVPQGNSCFSGTIEENLLLGKPDATQEEMRRALEDACIWDFVASLPQGLQTCLGEKGLGISEGQAQRIAIARALLHEAPILLLDEATSALDVETEKKVLSRLKNAGTGKTCIFTTHRPSVAGLCDKVYRVSACKIVEEQNITNC